MKASPLIGALCAGVFSILTMSSSAFAAAASNVKCDKCVGTGDIAKKAITSSRIKPGAVTKSKLSDSVLDLMQSSSSAKSYVIVDSNGQVIGGAIGGDAGEPTIMTSKKYIAEVEVIDGKVSARIQVLFTGVDCTGTAYIDLLNSLEGTGTDGGYYLEQDETVVGAVYNAQDNDMPSIEYWYVPRAPTLVDDMPVLSVKLYDWGTETVVCDSVSATIDTAVEIFPNDPAVTGFPNSAFSAPLGYDYR